MKEFLSFIAEILGFIFHWVAYGLMIVCSVILTIAGFSWFFGYSETASTFGLYALYSFLGAFLFIALSSILMDKSE